MQWVSRRRGTPDPSLELQAPAKPQQVSDWLTRGEFARMPAARRKPASAATGPHRARQAGAAGTCLSSLVCAAPSCSRCAGETWISTAHSPRCWSAAARGKARRQPIPLQFVTELKRRRGECEPVPAAPVLPSARGALTRPQPQSSTERPGKPVRAVWSLAGVFPDARAERFHRDRPPCSGRCAQRDESPATRP